MPSVRTVRSQILVKSKADQQPGRCLAIPPVSSSSLRSTVLLTQRPTCPQFVPFLPVRWNYTDVLF